MNKYNIHLAEAHREPLGAEVGAVDACIFFICGRFEFEVPFFDNRFLEI